MGNLRDTHLIDDIQQCLYALLNTMAGSTSPWTSWVIKIGFPEEEVLEQFDKPIIYIMEPVQLDRLRQQGGSAPTRYWRVTIGVWLERIHGGTEELNIIGSRIMKFFEDSKVSCVDTTFNVTLGATTYTATNLTTMGIFVDGIDGDRARFDFIDEKDFRREWDLTVVA